MLFTAGHAITNKKHWENQNFLLEFSRKIKLPEPHTSRYFSTLLEVKPFFFTFCNTISFLKVFRKSKTPRVVPDKCIQLRSLTSSVVVAFEGGFETETNFLHLKETKHEGEVILCKSSNAACYLYN